MPIKLYRRAVIGAIALLASVVQATPDKSTPDMQAHPALTRFANEVLQSNPGVQAGRAALDAALAHSRAAGKPLYNPELEIDTERTDVDTTSLGISQTIDWSGKRAARARVADLSVERTRAEYDQVRLTTSTALLAALADRQIAQAHLSLAQARASLMDEFADLSASRHRAGDIPRLDLDLARLAAAEAHLQAANRAAQVAQSSQALVSITGPEHRDWPILSDLPPRLEAPSSVDSLPQIRAAMAQTAATRASVSLRERERRADPTLALRGGKEDSETLAGLTLSIPLHLRNDFRAEVDAAAAEQRQSEFTAGDLLRRAEARLAASTDRYHLVAQAWDSWEATGAASLDSQRTLMQRLWTAGEISTADYLVQLKQALDTRASALELRGQLWSAWIDWLDASGQTTAWLGLETAP